MDDSPRRLDGAPDNVTGSGTIADPWVVPMPDDSVWGWGWRDPEWHFPAGRYLFVSEDIEQPAEFSHGETPRPGNCPSPVAWYIASE